MKQTSRIIFLAIIYFVPFFYVSAQNSKPKIAFSISAGIPLNGKEYHPEKQLDTMRFQECQSVVRSGYTKFNSVNLNIDALFLYPIKNFGIIAGLSLTRYNNRLEANPDSAYKYKVCDDPYITYENTYTNINLPLGVYFNKNKLTVAAYYGLPILSMRNSTYTFYSGNENNYINYFWFFKPNSEVARNDFFYFLLAYEVFKNTKAQIGYKLNKNKSINHITLGITYSLKV